MLYAPTIGLEVHVQLNTAEKLFAYADTSFGDPPNVHTSPLCLALPGTLPRLNQKAVKKAVLAGLAVKGRINPISKFDRKNYFYPDLPKAYQISQFYEPYCLGGEIRITLDDGRNKVIKLTRIHIEEDAGKLIHSEDPSSRESFVDLNRAGTPLIEVVSEPEIKSSQEAYLYLTELKSIMEYIEVSDCNMEQGSLRCDANISIAPEGSQQLGTKVEIKNLNTFKGVKTAIEYEIKRQKEILESDGEIIQETRLWNAALGETMSMRTKGDAHDYRYFPEPDLMPVILSEQEIADIAQEMPELASQKRERFAKEFRLPSYDIGVLTSQKEIAEYFEETVSYGATPKKASNWIMAEMMAVTSEKKCSLYQLSSPEYLAELIGLIESSAISGKIAKEVLQEMMQSQKSPKKIVEEKNLVQITDESAILALVQEVITENEESVISYKNGKDKALGFLVGQVMKKSKGKANPKSVNRFLLEELQKN